MRRGEERCTRPSRMEEERREQGVGGEGVGDGVGGLRRLAATGKPCGARDRRARAKERASVSVRSVTDSQGGRLAG